MPEPIPDGWRKSVLRILRAGDDRPNGPIQWTPQAFQRWKTDTFGAWRHQAYDALIAALADDGILGNETTSMSGQLATYEFFFHHGSDKMYGKIALFNDRLRILILSAHRPKRGTL